MADRVYPSAKPAANGAAGATTNPPFSASKAQLYGASRPAYRPQPPRRHRRSCCCCLCLWLTLAVILLILIAATAGAVLYVLYRPHRPTFTVDSLKVSYINLTSSSSQLNSKLNFTITARNPNRKLIYVYDPISVSISTGDVTVGDGSFPAFVHGKRNTTVLKSTITGAAEAVDNGSAVKLKSDLKSKTGLLLKVKLETKVKVKMGGIKSPKVGIRVSCDGISVTVPTGKTASSATTTNAKCKVDLRIKIWKWTF